MGLLTRFKQLLKRFLPPPVKAFNREMYSLHQEMVALQKFTQGQFDKIQLEHQRQVKLLEQQINALNNQVLRKNEEEKRQFEIVRRQSIDASKYASESVWAAIFNNTIVNSKWLENKSFSPGRWAVGYAFLYVMYRVLNETHPKHILELGLGQSTRMIAQYTATDENIKHYVVEKDAEWISFFSNDFKLPENTELICTDYEMIPYKEVDEVRVFRGLEERLRGKKFNFISIDAPYGADMKQYSRIDILNLLPDCISENFVIMIDDCERSGETNTVAEMENKLKEAGILYKIGRYRGKKEFVLITAEHMGFLTSM